MKDRKETAKKKKQLTVRILKTGMVEWRKIRWFQPQDLKEPTESEIDQLARSLSAHGFALPFNVWEKSPGKLLFLDGHIRQLALKKMERQGVVIPDTLPANWISCSGEKEAARLVLIYTAHYGAIRTDVLADFIKPLNLKELNLELNLPGLKELAVTGGGKQRTGKKKKSVRKKPAENENDDDSPAFHKLTVPLTALQKKTVDRALKKAKAMGAFHGTENRSALSNSFVRVCQVFLERGA